MLTLRAMSGSEEDMGKRGECLKLATGDPGTKQERRDGNALLGIWHAALTNSADFATTWSKPAA